MGRARLAVALLLTFVGLIVAAPVALAAAYTYDGPPLARNEGVGASATRGESSQVNDRLDRRLLRSSTARWSSTTSVALSNATNTVGIPSSSKTKLQNYIDQLYRHANKPGTVGNGTTMDAIPGEIAAGGGRHIQKGEDIARGLRNWLSGNPNAPYCDRLLAQSLYDELVNALGYEPS